MFYAAQLVSRDGPLQVLWVAATLDRQLSRQLVDGTAIAVVVDTFLDPDAPAGIFSGGAGAGAGGGAGQLTGGGRGGQRRPSGPESAPLALRLSGQLLLGVCRIYNRKVVYLMQDCERALLLLRNIDPAEAPLAYGSGDEHHEGDLDEQELSERTAGEPNGARPPRQTRGQQQEGAQEEGEGAGRRARRRVARRSAAGAGQGQGMLDAAGDPLLLPVDEDEMLLAGGQAGRAHEGEAEREGPGGEELAEEAFGMDVEGLKHAAGLHHGTSTPFALRADGTGGGAPPSSLRRLLPAAQGGVAAGRAASGEAPASPWGQGLGAGLDARQGSDAGGMEGGYEDLETFDPIEHDLDEEELEQLRLPSQDLSALLAAPAPAPGPGPKEEADGAGPGRRRARRGRADSTEEGGAVEGQEGELDDDEDEERDGPQHSQEDAEGDPMGVGAVDAEGGVEQQQEQEWDIGPPEGPGWDVEMEEAGPDGAKHGLEGEGGDGEEDVGFVASGGGASSDVRPMPGTEEYDTPGAVRRTASTGGAGNVDGDGGAEGQKAEAGGNAAAVDDDEGVAEAGEEPLTPPEANGRQLRPRTRAAAAAAEGEEDSPERKGAKAKDAAATPSARALQRARREKEREAEQQAKKKRGGAGGGGRGVTVDDEGPGGSLVSLGAMREWLQDREPTMSAARRAAARHRRTMPSATAAATALLASLLPSAHGDNELSGDGAHQQAKQHAAGKATTRATVEVCGAWPAALADASGQRSSMLQQQHAAARGASPATEAHKQQQQQQQQWMTLATLESLPFLPQGLPARVWSGGPETGGCPLRQLAAYVAWCAAQQRRGLQPPGPAAGGAGAAPTGEVPSGCTLLPYAVFLQRLQDGTLETPGTDPRVVDRAGAGAKAAGRQGQQQEQQQQAAGEEGDAGAGEGHQGRQQSAAAAAAVPSGSGLFSVGGGGTVGGTATASSGGAAGSFGGGDDIAESGHLGNAGGEEEGQEQASQDLVDVRRQLDLGSQQLMAMGMYLQGELGANAQGHEEGMDVDGDLGVDGHADGVQVSEGPQHSEELVSQRSERLLVEDEGEEEEEVEYGGEGEELEEELFLEDPDHHAPGQAARRRGPDDGFTARTQAVLRQLQELALAAQGRDRSRPKRRKLSEQPPGDPLKVTSASELLAAVADVADPAAARRRDKEAKTAAGQQQQAAVCAPSPSTDAHNANAVRPTVSRMAAARTFYDLLVLSNRGYITLCKGAPPTNHGSGSGAGGGKEGVKRQGQGKGGHPLDGDEGKAGGMGAGQEQVDGEELYVVARARLTEVVVRGVGQGQGEGSKGANGAGAARTVNVAARAGPAA